jgi:hypothetical protein
MTAPHAQVTRRTRASSVAGTYSRRERVSPVRHEHDGEVACVVVSGRGERERTPGDCPSIL